MNRPLLLQCSVGIILMSEAIESTARRSNVGLLLEKDPQLKIQSCDCSISNTLTVMASFELSDALSLLAQTSGNWT